MQSFPTREMLGAAVLDALTQLGGSASVKAINDKVIEILELPDWVVKMEDESGIGTKLDYRLRWVRTSLKSSKKIKNTERGYWELI